jgi:hypothetical protein
MKHQEHQTMKVLEQHGLNIVPQPSTTGHLPKSDNWIFWFNNVTLRQQTIAAKPPLESVSEPVY